MNTTAVDRRVKTVFNHINPTTPTPTALQQEQCNATTSVSDLNNRMRLDTITNRAPPSLDVEGMAQLLSNPSFSREDVKKVYQVYDNEIVLGTRLYDKDLADARHQAYLQTDYILKNPFMTTVLDDPSRVVMKIGLTSLVNSSVGTKIAAQSALFGGSLLNLGSERHAHMIPLAERLDLVGSFAMTELAHGSNVRAIQTTATYDPKTQEFIVNTPNKGAIKWWIGNALYATVATVFAKLIMNGKDKGVHAFLVPLRDEKTGEDLPGVTVGDCGEKNGLRGVDNGFMIFDNVRIPRVNMLNKFSDVNEKGEYTSKYSSESRLFAAMLGELTTGRITIAIATLGARKSAATIATRYAFQRRQFGPDSGSEVPIIQYSSHVVRLMPIIASCYAYEFAVHQLLQKFKKSKISANPDDFAEAHALSAGMKAVLTWDTREYLGVTRECCGGHGYSAYNRFGVLDNDHDITLTYEGDNTVLIQQVGAYLMKQFAKQFKGNMLENTVKFLRGKMDVYVKRRNFVVTRLATKSHLKSSDFHLQAFEYRTAHLLQECVQVYSSKKKKMDEFYSWEASVPTMVRLGRAFVEQFALEQFVNKLNTIEDKKSTNYKALKLVCDVFALSIIDKNIGDFAKLVKVNKAHAISRLLEELCVEMRQYAISLVDAFEIPDHILDAPIGKAKSDYIDETLSYPLNRAAYNKKLNKSKILSMAN